MQQSRIRHAVVTAVLFALSLIIAACANPGGRSGPVALSIDPAEYSLELGDPENDTVQLTAFFEFPEGRRGPANATWTSMNSDVATVSESGLVTATGAGMTTIGAAASGAQGFSATAAVTVKSAAAEEPDPGAEDPEPGTEEPDTGPEEPGTGPEEPEAAPSGLIVSPASLELQLKSSETGALAAFITFDNDSTTPAENMSWTTADEDVATVSQAGLVTAVARGSTMITGRSADYPDLKPVTVPVTVLPRPGATKLLINPKYVEVFEQQSEQLSATVEFDDENSEPALVTWTVEDESIATVNDDGLVVGVASGNTTITGKSSDYEHLEPVTIGVYVHLTPEDMTTSSTHFYMLPGEDTRSYVYYHFPDDYRDYAPNHKLTWESSDESVATVANGRVTAHAPGTVVITITEPRQPHLPVLTFNVTVESGEFDPSNIYVDPYRGDRGADPGSRYHPFKTIAEALAVAVENSTIHIAEAQYQEETLAISVDGVTLRGDSNGSFTTRIKTKADGQAIHVTANRVTLDTLIIEDAGTHGVLVAPSAEGGIVENFTARNIRINEARGSGFDLQAVDTAHLEDITVVKNSGGGIRITASKDIHVELAASNGNTPAGVIIHTASTPTGGSQGMVNNSNITVKSPFQDEVPVSVWTHRDLSISDLHLTGLSVAVRVANAPEHVYYFPNLGRAEWYARVLESSSSPIEMCDLDDSAGADHADCASWKSWSSN